MRLLAGCVVYVLLIVAVDAGFPRPQMFEDFISKHAETASMMSEQYYQDSKVVEFHTGSFSHCATSHWWSSVLAQTTLTCAAHNAHRGTDPFVFKHPVGTCEWQFDFLTAYWTRDGLPVPNMEDTYKWAKVHAKCVFPDSFESCGYGSGYASDNHKRETITVNIDGWLYETPAWFKALYTAPVLSDGIGILCNPDAPSCCLLEFYNLVEVPDKCWLNKAADQSTCLLQEFNQGAGLPVESIIANRTSRGSRQNPRMRDSSNAGASKPRRSLGQNGNGDSYYKGYATIISGTVSVEHPAGGHKWETGMMNWVVGTDLDETSIQGIPPDDLFPAEAGKFTLKLDQKSDYGYDYYQEPPHKEEHPRSRGGYGEPDYKRY